MARKKQKKTPEVELKAETPEVVEEVAEKSKEVPQPEERLMTPEEAQAAGYKNPPINQIVIAHTYESYKALIERYKEQNPEKYQQKKSALEAKLKALRK
jgi:hypothetical protein